MGLNLNALAEMMSQEKEVREKHVETSSSELAISEERVVWIPIAQLLSFPRSRFNRYQEYAGEKMEELIESIRLQGILQPLIVREYKECYQIISGHNRRTAAAKIGWDSVPCIIRNLSDEDALYQLNEINVQQRDLLPSQKAFAYKIKLEALKRQGIYEKTTSCQLGTKLRSDELLAQTAEDSARQIQRYIRLTYLTDDLLDVVDMGYIGLNLGVSISHLRDASQKNLFNVCFTRIEGKVVKNKDINLDGRTVDKLIEIDAARELNEKEIEGILHSQKPTQDSKVKPSRLSMKPLYKSHPQLNKKTEQEIQEIINAALTLYFENV